MNDCVVGRMDAAVLSECESQPALEYGILTVRDMHCGGCVRKLEQALQGRVEAFSPSVATRSLELGWNPACTNRRELLRIVRSAGFTPDWLQDAGDTLFARRQEMARIAVSCLLTMQVMMLAVPSYFGGVEAELATFLGAAQWFLATPVVFYGGLPFLTGALRSIRSGHPTMDLPVGVAILLAWGASSWNLLQGSGDLYFESASMFVSLLSLGRWFEGRGRAAAAARIQQLLNSHSGRARMLQGAGIVEVPLQQIRVGDRLLVSPGESLPVDGWLDAALATVSEAVLHGESRPVARTRGMEMPAGVINVGQQDFVVCATRVGHETTLAAIARLAHHALSQRPRFVEITDRYAGWFVVAVLLLSAAGYGYWTLMGHSGAFSIALAILVASCPCALSLATPVALAASAGRLAKQGILVADTGMLVRAHVVDTVLFDKTGTLTQESMRLQHTVTDSVDPAWARRLAAGLERSSRHPIAQAFVHVLDPLGVQGVRQMPDGVTGTHDGSAYRLAGLQGDRLPEGWAAPEPSACTWVGLFECGENPVLLAAFGLSATLHDSAPDAVAALADRAPELVSGDAEAPTAHIAQQLGIARWSARCTASEKVRRVQTLQQQGRCVAVIGDGINDAACLAAADVSVAMGQGAALAQSSAGIILLRGDPAQLPALFVESERVHRRIRQNLGWAIGYNVVAFSAAAGGLVVPWVAALGMSLSSLLVVLNAIRRPRTA